MNSHYDDFPQNANPKIKWSRQDVSTNVVDFLSRRQDISQREFAREHGIPRTTLQHWVKRLDTIDEDPALTAFFESPAGATFCTCLSMHSIWNSQRSAAGASTTSVTS